MCIWTDVLKETIQQNMLIDWPDECYRDVPDCSKLFLNPFAALLHNIKQYVFKLY